MTSKLTLEGPQRALLSGNEAIARGAIEAGVRVAASYPGTPATEVLESLASVAKELGIHAEWSVNEKLAFEVAAGASLSGVRAIVSMKHVGMNVAADPLMTLNYTGVVGGFLLVTGDDPFAHSSQNEQDSRYYARMAKMPCIEPSSPQEALEMAREAFEISEKLQAPIMLRSTTRVSHVKQSVSLGSISKERRKASFVHDPRRFVSVGAIARELHKKLNVKLVEMQRVSNESRFNRLELKGSAKLGIIASGVSWGYVKDALDVLNQRQKISLLKIGFAFPLPDALIRKMLKKVKHVLVVEELEPFIEEHVKRLAAETNCKVEILGKALLPREGEFSTGKVAIAIAKILGKSYTFRNAALLKKAGKILPRRPPILCPGCPHRATFYAIKKAAPGAVVTGDIGCYSLGGPTPGEQVEDILCMGAGLGVAQGAYHAGEGRRIIAPIGDSTFLHAGMPSLLNAVHNKARVTLVIMDNSATAMTGFQPHPATGVTATGEKWNGVRLEEIVKALGVEFIEITDPYNLEETTQKIKMALECEGVSVVISRQICMLLARRQGIKRTPFAIDQEKCTLCFACVRYGCPAIIRSRDKVEIELAFCTGCGCCVQVCKFGAISEAGTSHK